MLNQIFTKRNIEVIKLLIYQNSHLREIAEKTNTSPSKVHSTLRLFKKYNLIKEKKEKNKRIISLNKENIILQKIISLINITELTNTKEYNKLKKLGIIGIYGSFAKGTQDKNSDLDLFIFTEKNIPQELIRKLGKGLKVQINLLKLNKNKLNSLKKHDKEFYLRLKLASAQLNGDIFD